MNTVRKQSSGTFSKRNEIEMDLRAFIQANRDKIHEICEANTLRNEYGQVVISPEDEWFHEDEWDELYEEVKRRHEDSRR